MKTNPRMHRGFTLVELLVVIVIIAALAGLTAPMVIRQRKKADQTEAVNNARQIGFALLEFETTYGTFMDGDTAKNVTPNSNTLAMATGNANGYFQQLIAGEISKSEAMFYAKTAFTKKPDGVYNSTSTALAAGEVGFGYIINTDDKGYGTSGNPSRPIICAPLDKTLSGEKFDKDMYDSKAVVLCLDNSAKSLSIDKDGKAQLTAGTTPKSILDTGDDTVWGTTDKPKISFPLTK